MTQILDFINGYKSKEVLLMVLKYKFGTQVYNDLKILSEEGKVEVIGAGDYNTPVVRLLC